MIGLCYLGSMAEVLAEQKTIDNLKHEKDFEDKLQVMFMLVFIFL